MKKLEARKQQKLERILDAAQVIFQSSGFIGASMDKIAEQAGVTKQTVYRYFPSKEALFKAALDARCLGERRDFLEALDLEDPAEALERFAVGFIGKHLSGDHLANIRLLVSEGPEVPEITRTFYALGPRQTKDRLARFLLDRFKIRESEFEINAFIAILLSLRMPVLTGLRESPSPAEILGHAHKAVQMFMKVFTQ